MVYEGRRLEEKRKVGGSTREKGEWRREKREANEGKREEKRGMDDGKILGTGRKRREDEKGGKRERRM